MMIAINKKVALLILLLATACGLQAQPRAATYSFGIRITGKGKPMILIPGLKGSADTYNDVVAHYKDHYKCYVITLAGFAGQPAAADTVHPLQTQRDEIIQYIIDQHLDKPVLVGFSFGGALALWIESTRPDLVGPLIELDGVPFDAAIDNPGINMDTVRHTAKKWHAWDLKQKPAFWAHIDSTKHTEKFRKEYFADVSKMVTDTARVAQIRGWDELSDYKATTLMEDELSAVDMRDSVKKISSPILVLGSWRGWDSVKTLPAAEARYKAQYAPAKNVTIVFSQNAKHFIMFDDFDWMIGEMDSFLRKY